MGMGMKERETEGWGGDVVTFQEGEEPAVAGFPASWKRVVDVDVEGPSGHVTKRKKVCCAAWWHC